MRVIGKGQSEIVTFILLFLIGLVLFMSAIAWSSGLFQQNVDMGTITATENFVYELDSGIQSVIKHGGSQVIDYNTPGTIEFRDSGYDDAIEIKMPITVNVPRYWVNVTRSESLGNIREKLDGTLFRIELSYPEQDDYIIDLHTEEAILSRPDNILIEKEEVQQDGKVIIRIKLTFQ